MKIATRLTCSRRFYRLHPANGFDAGSTLACRNVFAPARGMAQILGHCRGHRRERIEQRSCLACLVRAGMRKPQMGLWSSHFALQGRCEEGTFMQHCVGGYDRECMTGRTQIFSLRTARGKRLSTLQLWHGNRVRRFPLYKGQNLAAHTWAARTGRHGGKGIALGTKQETSCDTRFGLLQPRAHCRLARALRL